jgi:hypothetical protein
MSPKKFKIIKEVNLSNKINTPKYPEKYWTNKIYDILFKSNFKEKNSFLI